MFKFLFNAIKAASRHILSISAPEVPILISFETSCITFNNGLDRKTFLKYWLKKCNQEITSGSTMVKTNNDNMNLNQRPSGIVL